LIVMLARPGRRPLRSCEPSIGDFIVKHVIFLNRWGVVFHVILLAVTERLFQ
jgi:hypothetical protein